MTELFDKTLLPLVLQYDISIFDFWDMTLKEILDFIKAAQQKEIKSRQELYLQASLIANFVGCAISGKEIPPIYQVFPEAFQEQAEVDQKEREYQAAMLYKEQMLDFANQVNKHFAKRGENS